MKKEPSLSQYILFFVYYYGILFLLALVFRDLANWFFIPLLEADPITYWQTFGVLIALEALLAFFSPSSKKDKEKKFSDSVWESVARNGIILIFWGIGALIALAL